MKRIGLALLAFLPTVFLLTFFSMQKRQIADFKEQIAHLKVLHEKKLKLKQKEDALIKQCQVANPHYLEKEIETLQFLQNEALKAHSMGDQKRASFLKGEKNQLSFAPIDFRKQGHYQETEEKLRHPVELGKDDLIKLLHLIEHPPAEKKAPQLLIKHFQLKKKPLESSTENYLIHLELVKREKALP